LIFKLIFFLINLNYFNFISMYLILFYLIFITFISSFFTFINVFYSKFILIVSMLIFLSFINIILIFYYLTIILCYFYVNVKFELTFLALKVRFIVIFDVLYHLYYSSPYPSTLSTIAILSHTPLIFFYTVPMLFIFNFIFVRILFISFIFLIFIFLLIFIFTLKSIKIIALIFSSTLNIKLILIFNLREFYLILIIIQGICLIFLRVT
jgi:hypothetical protein